MTDANWQSAQAAIFSLNATLLFLALSVSYCMVTNKISSDLKVINEEFLNITESIIEQEKFVMLAKEKLGRLDGAKELLPTRASTIKTGFADDLEILEYSESDYSFPFLLGRSILNRRGDNDLLLRLGDALAKLYGRFWSVSSHTSPRFLLIDVDLNSWIMIPPITRGSCKDNQLCLPNSAAIAELRGCFSRFNNSDAPDVQWASLEGTGHSKQLVAYTCF
ncbi:hypothetical protein HNP46_007195, partial [Pseudomonas nitritireducens]